MCSLQMYFCYFNSYYDLSVRGCVSTMCGLLGMLALNKRENTSHDKIVAENLNDSAVNFIVRIDTVVKLVPKYRSVS